MAPRGRATNHHETPGSQTKQSNMLAFSQQDVWKTRLAIKNAQQNIEQLQTPTIGVTINKTSTTRLIQTTVGLI